MFSTDRDLLALEPNVFVDVPLISQQRVSVTDGELAGTTLSSVTADFEVAEVDAGSVVLIRGVAHEVIARLNEMTLTVSLPRAAPDGPAIGSGDGTGLAVEARTFALQAGLVHDVLLEAVGIDVDDSQGALNESMIVSKGVMRRLEALGTLERIYAGAVAVCGGQADQRMLWEKANWYHRRFRQAFGSARVLLDVDGDGVADTQRTFGVRTLRRG